MPRKRREIPWLQIRDGVYYVYWYDEAKGRTKRISLNTRESVEAQARYASFLATGHEIFRGSDRSLGVAVALDQYHREHVVPKVVARQRAEGIIALLKRWFKNTPLQDVDIPACRAYAAARQSGELRGEDFRSSQKVAQSTVRRELGLLQAAANHAAAWKRIGAAADPPTPMPSIELPPDGQGRAVFLTKEELAVVFARAEGRLLDQMKVLYSTAARRRSVERLTRPQINLKAGTINLTSPLETENERRSKKRRPVVPLFPEIRPIVERWLIDGEKAGSQWLWIQPDDMFDDFRRHLIACGFPDRAFPHVMRHTRASHLLQDGVPIEFVARLLGDTIATVERVYGHLRPDDVSAKIAEYGA